MNYQAICLKTLPLIKKVGNFIREERKKFDVSKIEYKGTNNLVSYVDKEAEKQLVTALAKILPEADFITEEDPTKQHLSAHQYHWVIDPLDGTTNFIHGVPTFSISVALMEGMQVVVGIVYEINLDECFYAWLGGGSFLNQQPIKVSPSTQLDQSLIATGFPYEYLDKLDQYFELLKMFIKNTHGIRRLGSAAVDLAYVACGRFEAFFEYNLNAWDVAAGTLLVKEAGGIITSFSGEDNYIFGREILAANPLHAEMLTLVKKHWLQHLAN